LGLRFMVHSRLFTSAELGQLEPLRYKADWCTFCWYCFGVKPSVFLKARVK
jgi:hypothetical protein